VLSRIVVLSEYKLTAINMIVEKQQIMFLKVYQALKKLLYKNVIITCADICNFTSRIGCTLLISTLSFLRRKWTS